MGYVCVCVCGADLCEEVHVVRMVGIYSNIITRFLRTVDVSHTNQPNTLTHTHAHTLTGQLLNSLEDWQLLLELMTELRLPAHTKTTPTDKATPTTESDRMMEASSDSKGIKTSSPVKSQQESPARDHEEAATRGSEHSVQWERGLQAMQPPEARPERNELQSHQQVVTAGRSSRPPQDLTDRTEVTWTHVFKLMLGTLSPSAVTRLLSKVDLNSVPGGSGAEVQLHRLLVRLAAVHTQQR